MTKRKIEIVLTVDEANDAHTASYEVWELSGFRVYTLVGSDAGLEVDDLASTIEADLTALDA